jgi:DUF4097 and DUF4098 domain-containing protein YvlB
MKRPLIAVGALLTVLMIAGGAFSLASFAARKTTVKNVSFKDAKTIRLDSSSGSVSIRGGDGPSVTGSRKVVRSFTKPSVRETVSEDGVLLLRTRCGGFLAVNCEVNYTLNAPKGVRIEGQTSGGSIKLIEVVGDVDVKSSAGGITAQKMGGALKLDSSAGSVRVEGASGPLDLSSSAGGVTVIGATSETVKADSSAGSVNITFVRAPMTVDAESSAGGVKIVVPEDSEAYRVDASTSAGDSTIEIKTDPKSKRAIKVRSSAGNVSVKYGAATLK